MVIFLQVADLLEMEFSPRHFPLGKMEASPSFDCKTPSGIRNIEDNDIYRGPTNNSLSLPINSENVLMHGLFCSNSAYNTGYTYTPDSANFIKQAPQSYYTDFNPSGMAFGFGDYYNSQCQQQQFNGEDFHGDPFQNLDDQVLPSVFLAGALALGAANDKNNTKQYIQNNEGLPHPIRSHLFIDIDTSTDGNIGQEAQDQSEGGKILDWTCDLVADLLSPQAIKIKQMAEDIIYSPVKKTKRENTTAFSKWD